MAAAGDLTSLVVVNSIRAFCFVANYRVLTTIPFMGSAQKYWI